MADTCVRKRIELQREFSVRSFPFPRVKLWQDGDGNGNAMLYVGLEFGVEYGDPGASVGLQMYAAPGSLLYRLTGWWMERKRR